MTSKSDSSEILIVAAEASSTLYAQRLLEEWQRQDLPIKAFGIGSRQMEKLNFEIIGRSEELAVVGFKEVIAHYPKIKAVFNQLLQLAKDRKPKLALLLDYPDFNLRLAKKLKKMGIPVVYYISPQVWAWRQGRVHQIKKNIDKMLVVFPFEEQFYQKYNVPVKFVGHPLLDEIDPHYFDHSERNKDRQRFGVLADEVLLALMPGSRRSELRNNLPTQLEVAQKMSQRYPRLKIALFLAPGLSREDVLPYLTMSKTAVMIVQKDPLSMLKLPDLVLCASGTATLVTGLMEIPMVIMYKMNAISAWIAKKLVTSTPFFGMVNLVLNRKVVEEKFQEQASVDNLVQELAKLVDDKNLRKSIAEELKELKTRLGDKGAALRVTEVIKEYFA